MPDVVDAKAQLRLYVQATRLAMSPKDRCAVSEAIAHRVLGLPELREPATVAAFSSLGTEPGTGPLLAGLAALGHRVLLPVLLPDRDLDWVPADAPDERLGVGTVARARVVVCPGLAGDVAGGRLGRGGGSYDRALARCGRATLRVLLLHDGELLEAVPASAHDQRVHVIVTPTRTLAVPAPAADDVAPDRLASGQERQP